jgi:hypothetical protein
MHLANFVYDVKFNIFHEEGRTMGQINQECKETSELNIWVMYKTWI